MTALYIIGAIAAFISLLLSLRIRLRLCYREEFSAIIYVLFFRFMLYPAKKKKIKLSDYSIKNIRKKEKKEKKEKQKPKKTAKKGTGKSKAAGEKAETEKLTFGDTVSLTRTIVSMIRVSTRRFIKYLRVKILKLRVRVSADDASETAILYGAASQSMAYLLAFFDECLSVKYRGCDTVGVWADFTCKGFAADVDIVLSLRVWQIIAMLAEQAVEFIKRNNRRKK